MKFSKKKETIFIIVSNKINLHLLHLAVQRTGYNHSKAQHKGNAVFHMVQMEPLDIHKVQDLRSRSHPDDSEKLQYEVYSLQILDFPPPPGLPIDRAAFHKVQHKVSAPILILDIQEIPDGILRMETVDKEQDMVHMELRVADCIVLVKRLAEC